MTPATGGLIPAGTEVHLSDGHGGHVTVGHLAGGLEVHFADDTTGDDDDLAVAFARVLTEPITVTLTDVDPAVAGLLCGYGQPDAEEPAP